MAADLAGRHPGTKQLFVWFDESHLPPGPARSVSAQCRQHAEAMVEALGDGPELTAGLRKLLEAKDCFVRQAIADNR